MRDFSKAASEPSGLRFGPFLLDHGTRQLSRAGEIVHLTPKAFELLHALLEKRPRAVSKAALHELLWPSTFVADANLAGLIAEVRVALQDNPRQPTFIRTVHAFGYAFCGNALPAAEAATAAPPLSVTCWLVSARRRVTLREGENFVGRDPGLEVWLDAKSVSRRHARVSVTGSTATVEDLGSKNGTWIGSERLASLRSLADGDRLRFGGILLTFRVWSDGGSTETRSETMV